jgi:hypothetical protein
VDWWDGKNIGDTQGMVCVWERGGRGDEAVEIFFMGLVEFWDGLSLAGRGEREWRRGRGQLKSFVARETFQL